MKNSLILLVFYLALAQVNAQIEILMDKPAACQTIISGNLYDSDSTAVIFANVALYRNGILLTLTESDFDGKYSFFNIEEGIYDVEASFLGLATQKISGIKVKKCETVSVSFFMAEEGVLMDVIEVVEYKVPLVSFDNTTQGISITSNNYNSVSNESYDKIEENPNTSTEQKNVSTFSVDVDRASYSNVRRFLNREELPPADAVRIEELINYFHYDYSTPHDGKPFSFNTELSACPWDIKKKLLRIGLQGKQIETKDLPPTNLVFLIDVSGSMQSENKLPLVKKSLNLLVDQMRQEDKIALVVYAGAAGLVLPSTNASEKTKIKNAIDALESGGSTAGGAGIKLAYNVARESFIVEGNNRIVLATDGDFNVGASSDSDMLALIEKERASNVFISVLGFGMGNYKDSKMQKIADAGNGNHSYVDNINEAKKLFVNEFGGTLFTIAKDVKIQIHFNPKEVSDYRLIGYENRILNTEDFEDDKKDAGDIGAGHSVTALYEITLNEKNKVKRKYKKSVYSPLKKGELANIQFRYKAPDGDESKLIKSSINNTVPFMPSKDHILASAVAEFGLLIRDSKYKKQANFENIYASLGWLSFDENDYIEEFYDLVETAETLVK